MTWVGSDIGHRPSFIARPLFATQDCELSLECARSRPLIPALIEKIAQRCSFLRHAEVGGALRWPMRDAIVGVDPGLLRGEERTLVRIGCALALPGDVHGLRRAAIAAFERNVGFQALPLGRRQLDAHIEKSLTVLIEPNMRKRRVSGPLLGAHFWASFADIDSLLSPVARSRGHIRRALQLPGPTPTPRSRTQKQ